MVDIVAPLPEHDSQIEDLLNHAFGENRRVKTSYRYRDGVEPVGSLHRIALSGDDLIGSIQFWPAKLGAETVLLLGPIALWAGYVGQGVGTCLMRDALARARAEGWKYVFLVGDPNYYRRFGFVPAATWGVTMPDEDQARFQGYLLGPDAPPPGVLKVMQGS
jgi:predicted N-acetyltransferase YhbS